MHLFVNYICRVEEQFFFYSIIRKERLTFSFRQDSTYHKLLSTAWDEK